MLVKNLTSKTQGFEVKEIMGDHNVYTLYLEPYASTELDHVFVFDQNKYKGILTTDLETECHCTVCENVVEEPEVPEVAPVVEAVQVEEKAEESESFVCELCGAEFASARGLAAHKSKAHAE